MKHDEFSQLHGRFAQPVCKQGIACDYRVRTKEISPNESKKENADTDWPCGARSSQEMYISAVSRGHETNSPDTRKLMDPVNRVKNIPQKWADSPEIGRNRPYRRRLLTGLPLGDIGRYKRDQPTDLDQRGLGRREIAIVARPFLPKTKRDNAGPLAYRESLEESALVRLKKLLDPIGKGSLDCFEQRIDLR